MGHDMGQERHYLDWNATAPLRPEARAAMLEALDAVGNASSVHAEGRRARQRVEDARAQVAALVGTRPRNVIFTSGATEANTLALTPALRTRDGGQVTRLLASAIEHPSVKAGGRFAREAVSDLPVRADGRIDLDRLAEGLRAVERAGGKALVAVMAANNETGVVQPVAEAAALVRQAGGLLLVDAVQGIGRMPCDINALGADFVSISAHKIGGPQGAGALICRDEDRIPPPLLVGGGQERGRRAGTENVAALAGFGAAAQAVRRTAAAEASAARRLRDLIENGLRAIAPETIVFGAEAERLPNTTLFALPGVKAETALIALDLAGLAVSSGSACSSGKVGPSDVLAAMGVAPELAAGAIRISTGYASGEKEVNALLEAWRKCVAALGKRPRVIAA